MRIGIDARFYGPFGKGLGRYVQKLIEHLELLKTEHEFVIFLRKENWDDYQPRNPQFRKVVADFSWYSLQEQLQFPLLLQRERLDLVHFPHYNVPLLYRRPFIVTIHDLIVSRYPTQRASTLSPFFYRLKHAGYTIAIRNAVYRARHILTVSEYSKQDIIKTFGRAAQDITVTYEAADQLAASPSPEAEERVRAWEPYLLYVGNAYPHKNLEGLLRAFAMVRKDWQKPLRLVLVGKRDYFYDRLQHEAQTSGLDRDVVFPGYVTDTELASLYSHALLYVFPSFMEGFGLPPLEAMNAGVPVASSNWSCLPEVLGDGAAFFDPKDPAVIADTLLRLLRSPQEREDLGARGTLRVQKFRWDILARTTLSVYTTKSR